MAAYNFPMVTAQKNWEKPSRWMSSKWDNELMLKLMMEVAEEHGFECNARSDDSLMVTIRLRDAEPLRVRCYTIRQLMETMGY